MIKRYRHRRSGGFCVLPSGDSSGGSSGGVSLASVEVFVADYSIAADVSSKAGVVDVYKRLLVS